METAPTCPLLLGLPCVTRTGRTQLPILSYQRARRQAPSVPQRGVHLLTPRAAVLGQAHPGAHFQSTAPSLWSGQRVHTPAAAPTPRPGLNPLRRLHPPASGPTVCAPGREPKSLLLKLPLSRDIGWAGLGPRPPSAPHHAGRTRRPPGFRCTQQAQTQRTRASSPPELGWVRHPPAFLRGGQTLSAPSGQLLRARPS